jgi:ABC-type antimicrobial peptide transport system permease subunit
METAVARDAEAILRATDKELMVRRTSTLSTEVEQTTARERLLVRLSSGFGALAVVLAAIGLYGTLSYSVRRRTREIGVRIAFGAERATVLRMVLSDALKLVVTALLAGVPLALGAGYSLRAFLFGVTPLDPVTFAGACALLTITALLAAYLPARRAAAVDPIVALRWE